MAQGLLDRIDNSTNASINSVFQKAPKYTARCKTPVSRLVICAERLSARIRSKTGLKLAATDVLIDAPPVKLEVQFQIDVRQSSGDYLPLSNLSPVVNTLATNQFDNFVKRVRVFVNPAWLGPIQDSSLSIRDELMEANEDVAKEGISGEKVATRPT